MTPTSLGTAESRPRARGAALALSLAALAACGAPGRDDATPSPATGVPRRIVSLACNGTDILLAMGQGDRLVAVEEDCPCPGTESLVKIRNEDHPGKMAAFSVESVLALRPDAVIAHPDLRTILDGTGLRVVYTLDFQSYENIPDLVEKVGALLDMPDRAKALLDHMRAKADEIRARTKDLPRVSVYYEAGAIGATVGGLGVMNAMIELAGGRNVAAGVPRARTTITQEAIFAADPEVIVLGAFADSVEEVRARPGWERLRAVRAGRVHHILPERRNVAQGTPRCVDECEAVLLPWLHPEATGAAPGR